jgi:hypothetical protein
MKAKTQMKITLATGTKARRESTGASPVRFTERPALKQTSPT